MAAMKAVLANWNERHQNPVSRWLHFIGIPLTLVFPVLGVWQLIDGRWDLWWRPTLFLVAGYALQWLGHVIEGNDMGEVILIKKLLGRPYVAVSPRSPGRRPAEANPPTSP